MVSIAAPLNIVMVCTGNICRSPMAAGLLVHLLPPRLQSRVAVASAGTHALVGRPAEPHACKAMAEMDIDITAHRAQQVNPPLIREAALVLTMERDHQGTILLQSPASGPRLRLLGEYGTDPSQTEVFDPYGQGLFVYRACARLIRNCMGGVINEIEDLFENYPVTPPKR